jgi:hypothetical protein
MVKDKFNFVIAEYLIISIITFLNFSNLNATSYDEPNFNFIEQIRYYWPNSLKTDEELINKKNIGIIKVGTGYDEIVNDSMLFIKGEFFKKNFIELQLCNVELGYKYYGENNGKSFPFLDFNLGKINLFSETYSSLSFDGLIKLFEKKTTWFSNEDLKWLNIKAGLGYDFAGDNFDLILSPIAYFGFGYETLKLDTLSCTNLDNDYRNTKILFCDYGIKFKTKYKSFSLDLLAKQDIGVKEEFKITLYSVDLAYTVWKTRSFILHDNTQTSNFFNAFRIYLGYDIESLKIFKKIDENNFKTLYSISNNILKFGVYLYLR